MNRRGFFGRMFGLASAAVAAPVAGREVEQMLARLDSLPVRAAAQAGTTTIRTALPSTSWRKLYDGVPVVEGEESETEGEEDNDQ